MKPTPEQIKAKLDELLSQYWDIAHSEGRTGVLRGDEAGAVLSAIQGLLTQQEGEPVAITDEMAFAFNRAISDGSIGESDVKDIKTGLAAAFRHITTHPAPFTPIDADMVTDEMVKEIFPTSAAAFSRKIVTYKKIKNDMANIYNAVGKYMGAKK